MNSVPAVTENPQAEFSLTQSLSVSSIFWHIRYARESDFIEHVPFLFWLIEVSEAEAFVTLGMREGVAHFSACQALDKLRQDASCYGIDAWPNFGGNIPEEILTYNSEMYRDISKLVSLTPEEAAREFDDEQIDVLLIDTDHAPSELETLLDGWLPYLSTRSVVLLNGVRSERFTSDAGRALIKRLKVRFPSFLLGGGSGLLMLLTGEERNERLEKLTTLKGGDSRHREVQRAFSRLGNLHYFECLGRSTTLQLREAEKKLEASENEKEQLSRTLKAQSAAYDGRNRQVAELQSRNHDLLIQLNDKEVAFAQISRECLQHEVELDNLKKEVLELQSQARKAEGHLAEFSRTEQTLKAHIATLEDELETRFGELATLTASFERLKQEKEMFQNNYEEILNSTTWKMTGVARRAIGKWRAKR